jgi:hypothetical protein
LCTPCYGIRSDLKVHNFEMEILQQLTFVALRSFTLESGQEEIERMNRRRKERHDPNDLSESRRGSVDSIISPTISHSRAPALSDVLEEDGTFAIGGDEDEDTDDDHRPTPAESTPTEQPSQASSVSSCADDAVPTQLRGMSEKARGKMPGKLPPFVISSTINRN